MRKWPIGLLTFIASLTGALTAEAAAIPITSVTPTELLADYNVIVNGQFNDTSDVHGPALIGGNLGPGTVFLNFNNVSLGTTAGTTPITGYGEVNVSGSQTAPFNTAFGHVFIGGSTGDFPAATSVSTSYGFPPGGTVANNPTTFSTYIWTPLTGLSNNLALLPPTYTVTSTTFNGIPNADGVAVLTVPLSTLNGLTGTLSLTGCLALSTPCDAVVDVTGTGTFAQGFSFPTALQNTGLPNVIFNFGSGITGVAWGVQYFDASILAPDAVASNNGASPLVGNLIAASVSSAAPIGGEIHNILFDCSDNLCTPDSVPVPEPGSLALLGTGLGSLVLIMLRSRRRHSLIK